MAGPYGTVAPPSFLVTWSEKFGVWRATAVMTDRSIQEIEGPSTTPGFTPADAIEHLLTKRACAMNDAEFPATMVGIEVLTPLSLEAGELRYPGA